MAKKQTFGDKSVQSKATARKMAKVIVAYKAKDANSYDYRESIVDLDKAKDIISGK